MMDKLATYIGLCVRGLAGMALVALLDALLVFVVWNYVIPSVFGLREISITEAYALCIVRAGLFKSSPNRQEGLTDVRPRV
jgi:hypothetical protein